MIERAFVLERMSCHERLGNALEARKAPLVPLPALPFRFDFCIEGGSCGTGGKTTTNASYGVEPLRAAPRKHLRYRRQITRLPCGCERQPATDDPE